MKVLLAVNLKELEEFIAGLPYLELVGTLDNKNSIIDACSKYEPDIMFLSNYLLGEEDIRQILLQLTNGHYKGLRIIYLYGEADAGLTEFSKFLDKCSISDCLIGSEVTSTDIETVLHDSQRSLRSYDNRSGNYGAIRKKKGRERTIVIKELDKAVITVYSNHCTGKTHTAWNLSYCFSSRGYKVGFVNIDRGYSANLYFGIADQYQELLQCISAKGMYGNMMDYCYRRGNLYVITGKCGSEELLEEQRFSTLLFNIKSKCDITLIDTRTGLDPNTLTSLKNSTVDLLVFDSDLQHFHMNMKMLDELGENFIPEKTIAVINNCDVRSSSYRFIYNEIMRLKLPFKGIIPLSSCMDLSHDLMYGDKVPYQYEKEQAKDFCMDMDKLLSLLNSREKRKKTLRGLFG